MLWPSALNSIALTMLTVALSFMVYKLDKVLTKMVQHDQTLYGVDGRGGLESRVTRLERQRHGDYVSREGAD